MSSSFKTTQLRPFQDEEAVMDGKSSWVLWLLGVVIGGVVSTACWFAFSLSGRVSLEGNISGGAGSRPEVSRSADSETNHRAKPNETPAVARDHPPEITDHNVTALWISERSGKAYIVDDTDGQIAMFEEGPDHRKMMVGTGQRSGSRFTIQFHSTLDDADGILELDLSNDGKALDGFFRGLDPTKEGRVRLLRSTMN